MRMYPEALRRQASCSPNTGTRVGCVLVREGVVGLVVVSRGRYFTAVRQLTIVFRCRRVPHV